MISKLSKVVRRHQLIRGVQHSQHIRFSSSSISNSIGKNKHYDVAIVGGGPIGATMASLLKKRVPSLSVALLDSRCPPPLSELSDSAKPNARAYALSPNSLKQTGVVRELETIGRVGYYDSMQVWESDGPAVLSFDSRDLDLDHLATSSEDGHDHEVDKVLGAVVEDAPLVSALWDSLRDEKSNVDLLGGVHLQSISASPTFDHDRPVTLTFTTNTSQTNNTSYSDSTPSTITTNILVAADGANSFVRNTLSPSFPTHTYSYNRHAVTCTVALDASINRTAFQRFLPNGPIALLPVGPLPPPPNDSGKAYANIVWSTTPTEAARLKSLPTDQFLQVLNENLRVGPVRMPPLFPHLTASRGVLADAVKGLENLMQSVNGGLTMSAWTERRKGFVVPPEIVAVEGRVFGFDLTLRHVQKYFSGRVVLVGDGTFFVVLNIS